jgi:hypothetical protein
MRNTRLGNSVVSPMSSDMATVSVTSWSRLMPMDSAAATTMAYELV